MSSSGKKDAFRRHCNEIMCDTGVRHSCTEYSGDFEK